MKPIIDAYRLMFARNPLQHGSLRPRPVTVRPEPAGGADLSDVLHGMKVLWDGLPGALLVFDLDRGDLLHLNPAAERLLGAGAARAPLDPALGAWWSRQLLQDWSEQAAAPEELRLDQDRAERWLQLQRQTLCLADPRMALGLVSLVDVTQRRQLERALQESDTRFREVTEAMCESLFVTNPAWDTLYFSSPLLLDILGLQASELRLGPGIIRSRVHPDDLKRYDERLAQQTADALHKPVDIIIRIVHPAKGQRWMRLRTRMQPHGAQGQSRIYGMVGDVTEAHERQRELKRARDLAEAASLAKSEFMANMSHEIRTPMNGILGMSELLIGTALSAQQSRYAKAVHRSGETLLRIINDILDLSRVEAGKLELEHADFELRAVVEDTLEMLAPRAYEKGLELNFRERPGLPALVHGDALRLRQVLINLIANAIKFTDSGEVLIQLDGLEGVGGESGRWMLEFQVIDTGIGIAPDVQPRLFTAFTQANGSLSRRYGGTGLGLAISRQLVELMGGQISVHSRPGQGSQFVFSLAVQSAQPRATMQPQPTRLSAAGRTLIVHAHDNSGQILKGQMEQWGYRVDLVADAEAALRLLRDREHPFELALLDLGASDFKSLDFMQNVRTQGLLGGTRWLLLSTQADGMFQHRALAAGYHQVLGKPLRREELRLALMGRKPATAPNIQLRGNLNFRVLVIEDNPVNQEVISQMLTQLGCQVELSSDALSGLKALCEHEFDLVMMDIQMPGMDGIEALGWFRRGPSTRFPFRTPPQTKVAAVTANALGGDEQRLRGLGFDDYLSKPFRQRQLQELLARCLLASGSSADADAAAKESSTLSDGLSAMNAPHSPTASSITLDAHALDRLRELDPSGNNRLLARVATAFLASLDRLMPELQAARTEVPNLAAIRHVAHTLKSSSASIGALDLSRRCAEIEQLARDGQVEGLEALLDGMQSDVEYVRLALQALLSEPQ
ncbi:MAG: response regulator [Burkholderiaceae bacterium]|nr:response regulator [Burkholderiaceae bacterium]